MRVHKFNSRFNSHWPDWTAEDIFSCSFCTAHDFDKHTNFEYSKRKALKVLFIPGHSAEQSDNTGTYDIAAQVCIRRLNNGIVLNYCTATDVRADECEDAELVYMSGVKTFYTSKFGARGFMLTEPVQANPSHDATSSCRNSMSNRSFYTFAYRLKFYSFMISFISKLSDDYDF